MKSLQALLPQTQAAASPIPSPLREIRKHITQYALLGALIFEIMALIANLHQIVSSKEFFFAGLYAAAFLLIMLSYWVRGIPYHFKSIIIVLFFMALGSFSLYRNGFGGDGRIFLITGIILAAALEGTTAGIISLILSIAALLVIGFLMTSDRIFLPLSAIAANSASIRDWISGTVIFTASMALALTVLLILINDLENSLKKQSNLSQAFENQSGELEKTIAQRTLDLEYRLGQLRTAAEISRLIGNNLNPQSIMDQMAGLLQERFDLYYVGIFLIDDLGKNAVLRTGTGEAGRLMIAQHHKLAVGGASMIGWAISNRKARIALDVGVEAIRFNNPFLPLTRSEMALPLISRDHSIGAISLQSGQSEAFDADDITVLQGIADIFATALDNARLYQDAQGGLDEIKTLHQRYLEQAWTQAIQSEGDLSYTYETGIPIKASDQSNSLVIPISLRDQIIGQVTLDIEREQLTPDELVFIDTLAAQTAQALENARLLEATQRQVNQEQLLNKMTSRFSTAYEVEDILRVAAQELGKLPNVAEVSVILNPPDNESPISPTANIANRIN